MQYVKIRVSQFDGNNHALWTRRMKTYIQEQGFDVWKVVVDGYTTPTTPPTYRGKNKLNENKSRDTNEIFNGLDHSVYVKVMHFDYAKDIWEKLQNI
jgi:hypothetical protein